MADGDHRHALRFQHLERFCHIKNGLGPRSHHSHRRLGQLHQVGRDVKAVFRTLMHAADPASCENRDLGQMGGDHGGGDGGGASTARGNTSRHIGTRQFRDILGLRQCRQLAVFQTDVQPPVNHRYCRGNSTSLAYVCFDLTRDLEVLRIRHPVGDDRAFKRNNGGAIRMGFGDFGRAVQGNHILVSPETY